MTRYPPIRPSPDSGDGRDEMAVITFDDILGLTAHLPGVTESTSYGSPALKVRGKSFCRLWSEREYERDAVHDTEVLVVFCDVDEKPLLIEMSGGSLFTTAHYDGHGAVLIRLKDIPRHELAERLEESYLLKAPPSLRKDLGRR